jgi:hypothetical protein
MKNIYLIPTDNPSRLFLNKVNNKLLSEDISNPSLKKVLPSGSYQNIYITADLEIKVGDWCIMINDFDDNYLVKVISLKCIGGKEIRVLLSLNNQENTPLKDKCKKIILTTDPTLIANGVQAIDDDFLEWFVKNSNCEVATLEKEHDDTVPYPKMRFIKPYKIIIPQEELKQSTVGKEFYESTDEIITVYRQETLEEVELACLDKLIEIVKTK